MIRYRASAALHAITLLFFLSCSWFHAAQGCCKVKNDTISKQTLARYHTSRSTFRTASKTKGTQQWDEFDRWMHLTRQDEIDTFHEVQKAIDDGKLPQKTSKGTSGTYMLKNGCGQVVGVFKPGEEETYGPRNPRTSKRFQRAFAPCTYKRKGLLKNAGYLCEVGASKVDKVFELYLVPTTFLARISCPAFYWNCSERRKYKKCDKYPTKIGSFQVFVHGFTDASKLMKPLTWSAISTYGYPPEFMQEFQRLVILDYLIRNTDRHSDNWLIKFSTESASDQRNLLRANKVKIAAIDHGLTFPFEPYKNSQYKFGWLRFPCSRMPFFQTIIDQYTPILSDPQKQKQLDAELYNVFRHYPKFDKQVFRNQLGLLKAQKRNILIAFRHQYTPQQLAAMPSSFKSQ